VGFLRFVDEAGGKGVRGALFLISSRGEPVDFCFTRIDVHRSFLWRRGGARRQAVTSLIKVLFQAANRVPVLILALASEIPPQLFVEDIQVQVPLCLIAPCEAPLQAATPGSRPVGEIDLAWVTERPDGESEAMRLLEGFMRRHDPLEPFERAAAGLEEAFNDR
jgi:hypothetical protein